MMRHLDRLPNFVKAFGVWEGIKLYGSVYGKPNPQSGLIRVVVHGMPVWLRPTVSDRSIFFQVLVKREYSTCEWPEHHRALYQAYNEIICRGKTPIIVDAGANVGFSVLWFASMFPKAKIIAVEPDVTNLDVLRKNVAAIGNVQIIPGAICDRKVNMYISNPKAGAGALRAEEGEGEVAGHTIPSLVTMVPSGELFIVKIDIEGGEVSLFRSNTIWVDHAKLIAIELHDWLYPRKGTSRPFFKAISYSNFDILFRGENVFAFANRCLHVHSSPCMGFPMSSGKCRFALASSLPASGRRQHSTR